MQHRWEHSEGDTCMPVDFLTEEQRGNFTQGSARFAQKDRNVR